MNNILAQITQTKFKEVALAKQVLSLADIQKQAIKYCKLNPTKSFIEAITSKHTAKKSAVIAEIKKASPSKGILCENFIPSKIAKEYADNGAACLSVLTDTDYFMGKAEYLMQAKQACNLPILRKDFIIDEYQIYESALMGADCILLIASILDAKIMQKFEAIAIDLGLAVLPEIHHENELEKAMNLQTPMLGINNRNLATFEVNLTQTINLLPKIKDKIIVTESGILTKFDVELMHTHNVKTFLVGEAFMKTENAGQSLKQIFNI